MEVKSRPIRIGIDIHACRMGETGIYTFIWNTIARLTAGGEASDIALILYGPRTVNEPISIVRMREKFGGRRFKYCWTRLSPVLFSTSVARRTGVLRRWHLEFDRGVMLRLWRKLGCGSSRSWNLVGKLFTRRRLAWWHDLELVHHTAGILLPMHPNANVLTINDLIPHHFKYLYKAEHQWFAESFDRAHEMDAILVYSEHTKRDVIDVLGIDPAKIHVVPLAAHRQYRPIVDRMQVEKTIARYGLEDQRYVLHVGSLEPRKNLTRLVEAFHELLVDEPTLQHKLVFSGPRFSAYQPIFEAIEQLGMKDRVIWLGAIPFDDLPALMNGAMVFVYPSLYEGFGLPPLEAMACGTPVIASRASSLPEVVGDAGILVNPYRVQEITAALKGVLFDPELRKTLRALGLARAREFSWDRVAEQTMCIYRSAIAAAAIRNAHVGAGSRIDRGTRNQQVVHEWLFNRMHDELSAELNQVPKT